MIIQQQPTIRINGGTLFDFDNPQLSEFSILDIAHALAHICRFTGHVKRHYSVCQHSVHCSFLVPPEDAYAALMHDAPEAFVGDVAKPLKRMLPDYAVIEKRVEDAVFTRFNVPNPLPGSVKDVDLRMCATEQHQLMNGSTLVAEPFEFEIPEWSITRARNEFLDRFSRLYPGSGSLYDDL